MDEQTMVFDETTTEEENTTIVVDEEESGRSIVRVIVVAGVAGATVLAGWLLKRRGKIDEYRIKKLEKKGYVVSKPESVEEVENEGVQTDVSETE